MLNASPASFAPFHTHSSATKLKPVYLLSCSGSHEPTLSRADDTVLQHALVARGIPCHSVIWSDPSVNWERLARQASACIIRSSWDYYRDRDRFLTIMETIASRTILLNPLHVIRWNTHKSYLVDLYQAGLPTIPTIWLQPGMTIDIEHYGWKKAVLKPAVSTNAHATLLFTSEQRQQAQVHLAACGVEMLLQPFFENVTALGELSLVFLDGMFSHAFRKKCALAEDTQTEGPIKAPAEGIILAERVLEAIARILHLSGPGSLLFARIDIVSDASGHFHIMEVELTEPRLRLEDESAAADRLACAIVRELSASAAERTRVITHPQPV